ncbi:MAG: cupin domain-containing protein [Saprospiraceae bacterium]
MKISPEQGLQKLADTGQLFTELFSHGTLSVELYRPIDQDLQTPHDRDEVYIIISGYGDFVSDGIQYSFSEGDFFFVAAGVEHRFVGFSEDFSTWVIFYGRIGGEANS